MKKSLFTKLTQSLFLFSLLTHQLHSEQWEVAPLGKGEGGQVIRSLACDQTTGQYVIFGTDVGGIWHSRDGGTTWAAANLGFDGQGANDVAVDPKNPNRVFCLATAGTTGLNNTSLGVWRSIDQGVSWEWVYPDDALARKSRFDRREAIVIDPSSFDTQKGFCTVVYYGQFKESDPDNSTIFKSSDGGTTWKPLSSIKGKCWFAIDPNNGTLYAGKKDGIYRSKNKGKTFEKKFEGNIAAIDCSQKKIVACTHDRKIYVSTDEGETFTQKQGTGLHSEKKHIPVNLKVSPKNPDRILLTIRWRAGGHGTDWFLSHDGGNTWTIPTFNKEDTKHVICGTLFPQDRADYAWHPTDENIVLTSNKNYILKSTDGGNTFAWSNTGYSGLYHGQRGSFHFNVYNPDYVAFPSLDFGGGVTFDNRKTWHKTGFAGRTWGWTFGVYAVEPGVWFGGTSATHSPSKLKLKITRDYGKTFTTKKLDFKDAKKGTFSCYQDPTDKNVWFYYYWRSDDAGHTWKEIKKIRSVVTHDPKSKKLYGISRDGSSVVYSEDKGLKWKKIFNTNASLKDVAVDSVNGFIYAVGTKNLIQYNTATKTQTDFYRQLPKDQKGHRPKLWSVALDPVEPQIVYTVNGAHRYQPDTSVLRSTDSGKTWHSLTVSKRWDNLHLQAKGGGSCTEGLWVRVHPQTRKAYVGTNDFGYWRISPPDLSKKISSTQ